MRQNSLWWVITTKKHGIYLKVHSDFLFPVDLDLILTPTGVEAWNCLLTSAVTVVCLHSARRLYLVCGTSQLFPAFKWENCLFGHFIFPLDCLVASLQTMLLTQAPLLCCVCGLYIVYVVILFDLLVLFRCTWLFMLSKAPWALKALYKANMLLL